MDWFLIYVVTLYLSIIPASVWGAFSSRFCANVAQQVALCMFALWAVWRIFLIMQHGWGFPHEPMVVTALALYAGGTIQKALHYRRCKHD